MHALDCMFRHACSLPFQGVHLTFLFPELDCVVA